MTDDELDKLYKSASSVNHATALRALYAAGRADAQLDEPFRTELDAIVSPPLAKSVAVPKAKV